MVASPFIARPKLVNQINQQPGQRRPGVAERKIVEPEKIKPEQFLTILPTTDNALILTTRDGPWLTLSVDNGEAKGQASSTLTAKQVRQLKAALAQWERLFLAQ